MTSLPERDNIISLVAEAVLAGARQARACAAINLIPRTLQRWQADPSRGDLRPEREQTPANKLTALEREHLLSVVNSDEFGSMPPSQIVPILADRGQYLASESTIYRVMRSENQLGHRGAERPAQQRHKPRALFATAPKQLFSWDITYLPTRVMGIYFTCICSWIILAEKSLAGRFMTWKVAIWRGMSCATFAPEKPSCRTRWCCICQRQIEMSAFLQSRNVRFTLFSLCYKVAHRPSLASLPIGMFLQG